MIPGRDYLNPNFNLMIDDIIEIKEIEITKEDYGGDVYQIVGEPAGLQVIGRALKHGILDELRDGPGED